MDSAPTEIAEIDNENKLPETVDSSNAIISMIERIAMDPNLPLERLQTMMEMQERYEDRKAKLQFSEALTAAKIEMPQVLTNQYNSQTKSRYSDLAAIDRGISPVITKHGFTMSFYPEKSSMENHYGVGCTLSHNGGHDKEYHADIPADNAGIKGTVNKTGTHAFGSSMSYGRRYLKTMIFDVSTVDDDGNAAGRGLVVDEGQLKEIRSLIEDANADISLFCNYFGIESLVDLPASKFNDAVTSLNLKKAKNNA